MAKTTAKHSQPALSSQAASAAAETERVSVKKDLIQTVAVNVLFIALLIGLYYWNQQNGQPLDHWVNSWLRI